MLVLMILTISGVALGIDKDMLWSALTFSDTPETNESARQMGIENPELLEEILFIKDLERDNVIARESSYLLLQHCSIRNAITKEKFFDIAYKLLSTLQVTVFPSQIGHERKKLAALLGNYGWDHIAKKNIFPTEEVFQILCLQLDAMQAHGLISEQNVVKILQKKIEEAKIAHAKKDRFSNRLAIDLVSSVIDTTNEQTSQNLNPIANSVITRYCENLIALLSTP